MRLTRHSDYSLRVLIFLALRPGELANITEIANVFNVSRNHLVKVVHELSRLGYIRTIRGHGGGMELALPPGDISVGEIVRQTEKNLEVINCHEPVCPILPACWLKRILCEATDNFLKTLDQYTIKDLTRERNKLEKLIS